MLDKLNDALNDAIQSGFGIAGELTLGRPPNLAFGDYACNCAEAAKAAGVSPLVMANALKVAMAKHPGISKAETKGPFLNLTLEPNMLFDAAEKAARFHGLVPGSGGRVMVEYLSPNTNKPLHLGHVRNGVLGESLANLLEVAGHTVIRANLVNDRGIHICKSMLAYERFGEGKTPESTGKKGDHFVGDLYVRFDKEFWLEFEVFCRAHPEHYVTWRDENRYDGAGNERDEDTLSKAYHDSFGGVHFGLLPLGAAAEAMLEKWEREDPEVRALWQTMNEWVYPGFAETERRYGFHFDREYHESELYTLGKDIVLSGLNRGVLKLLPDGAIGYVLPTDIFGCNKGGVPRQTTLLRKNGTSLYITQDLGTAVRKVEDYGLDRSIYVVATEQEHHFKVLFHMLAKLGYAWADRCYHFSYEMVNLPSGKMKSRAGTVVDADNLADEMHAAALAQIVARDGESLSQIERDTRAEDIGLAAIKFYLLGFSPNTKVLFDPAKSLEFEGDTGPYCLYAYARAATLLRKAGASMDSMPGRNPRCDTQLGNDEERALAHELVGFPDCVLRAADAYNPTIVAKKILAIAQAFNRFYRAHQVLGIEDEELMVDRLRLVAGVAVALKRGLTLLGVNTLEQM